MKLTQEDVNNFLIEMIESISANVMSKDIRRNIYEDIVNAAESSDIILDDNILLKSDSVFDDVYTDTHGGK